MQPNRITLFLNSFATQQHYLKKKGFELRTDVAQVLTGQFKLLHSNAVLQSNFSEAKMTEYWSKPENCEAHGEAITAKWADPNSGFHFGT